MRSKAKISASMAKVKSVGTQPELKLKQALIACNLTIIESDSHLSGKPDIILPDHKIAIFVDGDFWHGNQWRLRGLNSLDEQFENSENKSYWVQKIQRNVIRDSKVTYDLLDSGWVVIRLWESQINTDLETCIEVILNHIKQRNTNPMISRLPEKTFIEFFAGIGLMRMGLENKGWKIKYANDFDPEKIEMYRGHFSQDTCISQDDIRDLSADDVPAVTLATASFPCNDLSVAGARLGLNDGKQSSAFWGFIRIINDLGDKKPPFVLLENVVGFLSSKNGEDFKQALLALNDLGYSVDAFILDAVHFVPQSRKRMFIVGTHRLILNNNEHNNLYLPISNSRPEALVTFILNHPEILWNIRPLPNQPSTTKKLESVLEDLDPDAPEWWNQQRSEYLFNQMSPKHQMIAQKMIAGNEWSYGTVFRRVRKGKSMAELRTDGIAGCLRTPRGGSGRQILIKAGFGMYQARLLTPRECARLMGADKFHITVGLNQALFGFGDAVCVPVIEWIAEHHLNPAVNEIIHENPLVIIKKTEPNNADISSREIC